MKTVFRKIKDVFEFVRLCGAVLVLTVLSIFIGEDDPDKSGCV